jgi:uncharacterized membrane protein
MTGSLTGSTNLDGVKRAVSADAIFCAVCGLLSIALAQPISNWIGLANSSLLLTLGIGLLIYGIGLFLFARRNPTNAARFAISGNVLWILGTLAVLVTNMLGLNTAGYIVLIVIALEVAVLAFWQSMELRKNR